MRYGRRSRGRYQTQRDSDLDSALDAMTVEELRSFLGDALERLDDEPRGQLIDALIARAAKGRSGWKPSGPSDRIVAEVKDFAAAASRLGQAGPEAVDDYLRQGTKAFLAGEHATARGVFEALLPPIFDGEIDLGQYEMIEEVLTVDEHACAAQYVVSVYTTTPLVDRAEALCQAFELVQGVASFWTPLEEMERVATEPLPDLDAFLPLWVEHLEREPSAESEWEGDRDRWLREAVLRLEGVSGLERIARKTKQPEALRAWCEVLSDAGEWAQALRACDVAVELVGESHWRGEFLDGAALAAQQLERRDATKRLEAAWLGAPSLLRLLRWLGACAPTTATLVKRAKWAVEHCPGEEARQMGLLKVLTGDAFAAARLLEAAPGLGWSREGHPGHVLFPAFAGLLADGNDAALSEELSAGLEQSPSDPLDMEWDDGENAKPKLTAPSIMELFELVRPGSRLDAKDRTAMFEAMRAAASRRVEGILGNKRRRHYGHAATLVVCCLELAPFVGKQKAVTQWFDDVRKKYSRFSAFQAELKQALAATRRSWG